MVWNNLECVLELIDVMNPCTVDQSAVIYKFDDNGISLSDTAQIADERYVTGQRMVDEKKRQALDDVMSHLKRNVAGTCDLDVTDGIICDAKNKVARAGWYRARALIYKELTVVSSRYN